VSSDESHHRSDGEPSGEHQPDQDDESRVPGGDDVSRVSYDCSPWAGETRRLLAGMLHNQEIAHVWEGTVLVVRRGDEAAVDELVEEVVATAVEALDPELPTVAYEISVLPAATQNEVVQALASEGIPHEWDTEGDIVIHERDAVRLEELLEDLTLEVDPGGDEGEIDLDGLELHDRLTDLFVAADRLVHDPGERRASHDLLDADEALDGVGVPFGFDRGDWQEVLDASAELVAAVREAAERGGPLHELLSTDDADDAGVEGGDGADAEERSTEAVRSRVPGDRRAAVALGGVPQPVEPSDEPADDDAEEPDPRGDEGRDDSVQARARRLRDLLRRVL
jgi:hypothetical protein